jgi:hypothetical protein
MSGSLSRRNFLRYSATGAAAGLLGWSGHAQVGNTSSTTVPSSSGTRSRSGAEFITRETEDAIRDGLDHLARNQYTTGAFSMPSNVSVGVTALASLALMAGGNQPGRGKYGKEISRAVDFVVSTGNGTNPGFLSSGDGNHMPAVLAASQPGPMYSHGFGTLFLSEVSGMLPASIRDTKVREMLKQAVAFTVSAQNNEGGWRYISQAQYADVSVTVAQMMALRAAKNAGFMVRKSVIDAGANFIKLCAQSNGGFSYFKGPGHSAFARTAAAIVGLYSAGIYEGKEIERGLRYLQQFSPGHHFNSSEIPPQHYWYGHYYAALAMWTAGDDYWIPWFPAIRDELLHLRQRGSAGGWSDPYHGSVYATAMALIILQLPNNYLPILQK